MAAKKKRKEPLTSQLMRSARAVRTRLSMHLSSEELHAGQDGVLFAIDEQDGISLRDLAITLAVQPPTISKAITRLSAQGVLEKQASATDKRQSVVHLTEKGRALVSVARAANNVTERQAIDGLSKKERRALRKLLIKVEANLKVEKSDEKPKEA